MTRRRAGRTVCRMRGRPAPLHVFGVVAMSTIVVASLLTEPQPGLSGDGPFVALGVLALVTGIALSIPRTGRSDAARLAGLVVVIAAACALIALQPAGLAYGAMYYVVVVSALRFELRTALTVSTLAVVGVSIVAAASS
jgi:hypothetical protein